MKARTCPLPITAHAASRTERRHAMWLFLLYVAAVVLPGGALLVLLHRLWLRMHM